MGYISTGLVFAEKPSIGIEPTRLYDASRWKNHGVHTNITMVRTPQGLWVRQLAGNGYISIPDHPSFDISTNLTAMVWVLVDDITATLMVLLAKYKAVGGGREWGINKATNSGKLTVNLGDPADGSFEGIIETDVAHFVNSVWSFVGFTFEANTVVIYFNGVAVDSTITSGAIPATLYNGTQPVTLGASPTPSDYLTGKLALPKLLNYTLSAGQILKIFNKERPWFGR